MINSTNQALVAETDSSLIRAELERLLSHRRFSGARQMSAFLRYVVSETLDGNGNRIKAYTVGVDALGKADDFDAQSDPSVRVLALRLRKSLETAYAEKPECHAVITMTVGSYVPQFYKPPVRESIDDSEILRETGSDSVTSSARMTPGKSAKNSTRDDISNELYSANRSLTLGNESVSQLRFAAIVHPGVRKSAHRNLQSARTVSLPDTLTTLLRERLGVVTAVILLAAAWQVSVKTVSAATVSSGTCAPQAKASSFSVPGERAERSQLNFLDTPQRALPNRF